MVYARHIKGLMTGEWMQHFHFISGLPRSGSTLLSAILLQNPRFHAGMTSPVGALFSGVLEQCSAGSEFGAVIDTCLLYTSPSPRDRQKSRMPSSA